MKEKILQFKIPTLVVIFLGSSIVGGVFLYAQSSQFIDFTIPCSNSLDWQSPSNSSAPCGPLHAGYQSQAKNGGVMPDTMLYIHGRYTTDFLKSYNGIYSNTIKASTATSVDNLCTDPNGFGIIMKCAAAGNMISGNLDDTLRFDGTKWKSNDFLSISKTQTKINMGSATPVNPPNSIGAKAVLVVNGTMDMKGTNYKPLGSTETRLLVDNGDGIAGWKKFAEIINPSMIKLAYQFHDKDKNIFPLNLGIMCPPDYPNTISGNGNCGGLDGITMSDSGPFSIRCRTTGNCTFDIDIQTNPRSSDTQAGYPAVYVPQPIPSVDVPFGENDGWFIFCSKPTNNIEVFAICSK